MQRRRLTDFRFLAHFGPYYKYLSGMHAPHSIHCFSACERSNIFFFSFPQDLGTWLKLASLARKTGRMELCANTLRLLGAQVWQRISLIAPSLLFCYYTFTK